MGTTPITPQRGEIVTQERLKLRYSGRGSLNLARGFGGTSDPTIIWQSMISDGLDAFTYFRELEEKDEDVGSLIDMLKLSVLARDWEIVPADDSALAQTLAEEIRANFEALPNFYQILDNFFDAAAYGVSIGEIMWDVSESQVRLTDVKDRPQELFLFNTRYQPQIGPLRYLLTDTTIDGIEVPEEKFLIFSYRMRAGNRRGRPLLRSVFWPSWFKRQTLRFWLRFGEKGPGTAAVRYQGDTQDEKDLALEAAEAIVEKIAVAVPQNLEIITELLTSARSQDPAVYENLVRRCALAIARRICGQTLTSYGSEDGKGSLALGDVHKEMFGIKTRELAIAGEMPINEQLIKRWVLWNYGPEALALAPKFCFDKSLREDLNVASQVDERLQRMGLDIPKKYVRERYGVPEPEEGEDVLEKQIVADPFGNPNDPRNRNDNPDSQYSEADLARAERDIRRLMGDLRGRSLEVFEKRIKTLVEEVTR